MGQVVDSVKSQFSEHLETFGDVVKDLKEDNTKTLSMYNQSTSDIEKAFVETVSYGARLQDEHIQSIRDARYEEMIEETEKIESPASRLHN